MQRIQLTYTLEGFLQALPLGNSGALNLLGFNKTLNAYVLNIHTHAFVCVCFLWKESRLGDVFLAVIWKIAFASFYFAVKNSREQSANRSWSTEITWLPGT